MINIGSIISKTKAYGKSNAGQNKIKELREKAFDRGATFGSGDGITSKSDYKRVANEYLEYLYQYSVNNPQMGDAITRIIQEAIAHAFISEPTKVGKGQYKVQVIFDEELLKRDSLSYTRKNGQRGQGSGIINIIALFNNGYDIPDAKVPYGLWETHGVKIRARQHRDQLQFMQQSMQEFLTEFKNKFDITSIELGEIYKK